MASNLCVQLFSLPTCPSQEGRGTRLSPAILNPILGFRMAGEIWIKISAKCHPTGNVEPQFSAFIVSYSPATFVGGADFAQSYSGGKGFQLYKNNYFMPGNEGSNPALTVTGFYQTVQVSVKSKRQVSTTRSDLPWCHNDLSSHPPHDSSIHKYPVGRGSFPKECTYTQRQLFSHPSRRLQCV